MNIGEFKRKSILQGFETDLQKAYTEGTYANTSQNRKLGIVGNLYKKEADIPLKKTLRISEEYILERTKNKYEACVALNKEGVIKFKKEGEKDKIIFTPEEIEKIRGIEIFTHNHPSSRCFSFADLALSVRYDMKEMRAIAPNSTEGKGAWVFKKGNLKEEDLMDFYEHYKNQDLKVKTKNFNLISLTKTVEEHNNMVEKANQSHSYDVLRETVDRLNNMDKTLNIKFYFEKSN